MLDPGTIKQSDNLFSSYDKGIFSSNPVEEKKLATYFMWLRDNFNNLTPSQKNDYNVLKVKQNFAVLKGKDQSKLTAAERDFLRKYGVNAFGSSPTASDRLMGEMLNSSANVNFITSKDQLPRPSVSTQGTTGLLTKVGKDSGFKKGQDVYKYQDYSTGETSYYYVVKDIQRYEAAPDSFSNPLARYQKLAEVVRNDPKSNKNPLIPGGGGSGTANIPTKTSPEKYVKLWYSADYKTVYEGEIQKQVLELLNLPDMVLSNYNWETIDSVQDSSGVSFYQDGEIIYEKYYEPEVKVQSSIAPEAANLVYKIQESLVPVHVSLNNYRSADSTILSNFGFHRASKSEITPLFPSYTGTGNPRYDIEIDFPDAEEVLGYTVYLVEEDGII